MQHHYVYILSSLSGVLYIGLTNDLRRRVWQHKTHYYPKAFTARYRVHRLVYYEFYHERYEARRRELKLKVKTRSKKVALIDAMNPRWKDLSAGWFTVAPKPGTKRSPPPKRQRRGHPKRPSPP